MNLYLLIQIIYEEFTENNICPRLDLTHLLTLNNPSFLICTYPPDLVLIETTEKYCLVSYFNVGITVINRHYGTAIG